MNYQPKTIRTFIGAKNYAESREFYRALGFEEVELNETMCLFKVTEELGFYLQDYYVRKWVNNSMVFLEVDDIEACAEELLGKGLHNQYKYCLRYFNRGTSALCVKNGRLATNKR